MDFPSTISEVATGLATYYLAKGIDRILESPTQQEQKSVQNLESLTKQQSLPDNSPRIYDQNGKPQKVLGTKIDVSA